MAGTMMARLMRMIPPWHLPRSAAFNRRSGPLRHSFVMYILPFLGCSVHYAKTLCQFFEVLKYCIMLDGKYASIHAGEVLVAAAPQGSVQFALHDAENRDNVSREMSWLTEFMSEKIPLVHKMFW
jgi:hypothetical protein